MQLYQGVKVVRPGRSFQPSGSSSRDRAAGVCAATLPDLKMVSQARVWVCHTLVLRLLCSSTGVTIIFPNVLIICEEHNVFSFRFPPLSKTTAAPGHERSFYTPRFHKGRKSPPVLDAEPSPPQWHNENDLWDDFPRGVFNKKM